MLERIRIVLISTFHPGNIGAAARAMKNMGLTDLVLVAPREFPHQDAEARAAGATDLLANARVVDTLAEAIEDCSLVIGTSARNRSFPWPMLNARSGAEKAVHEARNSQVAFVFGRERMGLHNEELRQCHFHLAIDAHPDYPVLNISAAVQVICYELWMAAQAERSQPGPLAEPYPRQRELEQFYLHLEQALRQIRFILPQHEGNTLLKLKRFFNRARPEAQELSLWRGILSAIQRETRASRRDSETAD